MTTFNYRASLAAGTITAAVAGYRLTVKGAGGTAFVSDIRQPDGSSVDFSGNVPAGEYIFETEAMGANGQPVAPKLSQVLTVSDPTGLVPTAGALV